MLFNAKKKIPLNFTRVELISSLVIFITNSITLYSFLYLLREAAFLTAFGLGDRIYYEIYILNMRELMIYNFILSLISTIFGFSSALVFLFNKPRRFKQNTTLAKLSILNDQRILPYFFLYWLFTISLAFFLLLSLFMTELREFGIQNLVIGILLGCCLVLFLRSILTIRQFSKKIKTRHLLIVGLSLASFALLISQYNFQYYNSNRKKVNSNNVFLKYDISLPKAFTHQLEQRKNERFRLVIAKSPDNKNEVEIIYPVWGKLNKINIHEIGNIINKEIVSRSYFDALMISCNIIADKNTSILHIQEVLLEFKNQDFKRISFAVIPNENLFHQRAYDLSLFFYNNAFQFPDELEGFHIDSVKHTLIFHNNQTFSLDNKRYKITAFRNIFKAIYLDNPHNFNVIQLSKDMNYQHFIFLYSTVRKIVEDEREIAAIKYFNMKINQLTGNNQFTLIKKHPNKTIFLLE